MDRKDSRSGFALRRPRYADVAATLALFVALGGGAVALEGKNSVNSGDIKNDTIKGKDIKDGTVGAAEIDSDQVGSSELEPDSVGSAELQADSVGSSELTADSVGASEVAPDALTGDEINEDALSGFQRGSGEAELVAGSVALFDDVILADTAAGQVELHCSGSPGMSYTNESGADATVIQDDRRILNEDNGIPNDGVIAMNREVVADGATSSQVPLSGLGALGMATLTVVAQDRLAWVQARVFTGPMGCDYIARVEHGPGMP